MLSATQARDRAEEMVQLMQKRARDLLDAEDGLARTARDLIEQKGLAPAEVRRNLEELVGRIRATKVLERIRNTEPQEIWTDTVEGLERRVDSSVQWLMSTLQLATAEEMKSLHRDIKSLRERIEVLENKG